ncbi:hypothetical protein Tco_0152537 [Tanacetum coccineum]
MGTKVTSSSGSVLEEPEIQKLQMQAKNLKENSLNKLNALKTTIQHLSSSNHSMYYEFREAFHRLFDANEGLFRSVLSRNMQNLEMQFSNETLHEKDSNSELRAIKGQFEHFIHSKMFELSKYNTNAREILQDFNAYTTMEARTFKETIIQNMDSIAQYMVERASHEQELKITLKRLNERDETSSGIVLDEEIEKKELEAHYGFMAKIQGVLPAESSSTDTPLKQVQNNDENNVFANERQHSKKNAVECTDERAALANLIANLTLDTEENKTILKQLKKANASLTQELEKCKTNLDETNSALGEAISCRDSCLIALQNKQNEFEKYKAFNDRTIDYDNNLRTSSNSRNKTEDTTPRYNNDNQSGQFGNQRTITVAGARETVGSPVVQQNGIQCFNCKGFGHYARECRKPKREMEATYKLTWQRFRRSSPEESSSTGQPLEQVQNHDESNVYDNVRRHSEQPESINDTYVLEKDDSNVTSDSSNICTNDNQADQNVVECVNERDALANLIANLTLDTEENKTILKQLKKANASVTQEFMKIAKLT